MTTNQSQISQLRARAKRLGWVLIYRPQFDNWALRTKSGPIALGCHNLGKVADRLDYIEFG